MGYIYWIASFPKSGNTWIRSFLNKLINPPDQAGLNDLRAFAPDEASPYAYGKFITKPPADITLQDFADARPRVQAAIAGLTPGFVFLKTHHRLGIHLGTPTINMAVTAGAIYAVRNPLDIVVSYSEFLKTGFDEAIETLAMAGWIFAGNGSSPYQACGSWSENVSSWTDRAHEAIHIVRYEDMVADPVTAFSAIARFLRADASPDQVRASVEASSFHALQAEEAQAGFAERPKVTERFFRAGEVDQWKRILSREQVEKVVDSHHALMKRFGYLDDAMAFLQAETPDSSPA